jgi:hypothetical protein
VSSASVEGVVTAFFNHAGAGEIAALQSLLAPSFSWFGRRFSREDWCKGSALHQRTTALRSGRVRLISPSFLAELPQPYFGGFTTRAFGDAGVSGTWAAVELHCADGAIVSVLVSLESDTSRVRDIRDARSYVDAVAWLEHQATANERREPPCPKHPAFLTLPTND